MFQFVGGDADTVVLDLKAERDHGFVFPVFPDMKRNHAFGGEFNGIAHNVGNSYNFV